MNVMIAPKDVVQALDFMRSGRVVREQYDVALRAESDALMLSFAEQGLFVRATIPAKVVEPGVILAKSSCLRDIAHAIHEKTMGFKSQDNRLMVTDYQNYEALIPSGDVPAPFVFGEAIASHAVDALTLRDVLKAVLHNVPETGDLGMFRGVALFLGAGYVRAIATETHRLAMATSPVGVALDAPSLQTVLLPKSVIPAVLSMCKEGESLTIEVLGGTQEGIRLSCAGRVIEMPRVDAKLPNHVRVFPKSSLIEAKASRVAFIAMVKRTRAVSDSVVVAIGENTVRCESHKDDNSSIESIDSEQHGEVKVRVDTRLVLDALEALGTEMVSMRFTDDVSAVVVADVNPETIATVNLIMPRRI